MLGGKPLIQYTIEAAQRANSLTTWVVSTEDEEIRNVALDLGAYVIRRPDELARDDSTTGVVLKHALEWMEVDGQYYHAVVCLHPTSPIRDPRHIDAAVDSLSKSPFSTLASVCPLPCKEHGNIGVVIDGALATSSLQHYIMNASIYAVKRNWLIKHNRHVASAEPIIPLVMDRRHSLDIDEEVDLKLAELFLAND